MRCLLAFGLVCLCFFTLSAIPQSKTQWEYKTEEKCSDEKRLNALGAEGWEMSGFAETDRGAWHCVFKRQK